MSKQFVLQPQSKTHISSQPIQPKPLTPFDHSNHQTEINNTQLKLYFHQIMSKNQHKNLIFQNGGLEELTEVAENNISSAITKGEIQLPSKRGDIEKIFNENKTKQVSSVSEQQRKAQERELRKLNLEVLTGKRQSASTKNVQVVEHLRVIHSRTSVLSKEQHQQFLNKITREKSQLSLKKKFVSEKQKQKLMLQEQKKKQDFENELIKVKEQKKRKALERLEQQKAKHKQKMQQQQQNNKKVNEIKIKKFLHEKLQQKYQQEFLIPNLEQRKKKLKEIRNQSKAFDIQQINQFEKNYIERKQRSTHSLEPNKGKQQWNYKAPDKPKKLIQILQDENNQTKLKAEQQNRIKQENSRRQSEFIANLKHINPIIFSKPSNLEVPKIQQKQMPDIKSIGKSYLQQAKKRKKSVVPQIQEIKDQILSDNDETTTKKGLTNYLNSHKSQQQYTKIREKRIQKIIESSETDNASKIIKLRSQAERLEEQQKRINKKQRLTKNSGGEDDEKATSLLLASIKAKMGIIDLYNKS